MRHSYSSNGNLNSSQVKQQIIRTAFILFAEQGYHKTTVRQISRKSGVLPSNVYNYFANKDEIFRLVLENHHPWVAYHHVLEQHFEDNQNISVSELINFLEIWWKQNPDGLRLHLVEIQEFQGQHLSTIYKKLLEIVTPFVLSQQADGKKNHQTVEQWSQSIIALFYISLFFQCLNQINQEMNSQKTTVDYEEIIGLLTGRKFTVYP